MIATGTSEYIEHSDNSGSIVLSTGRNINLQSEKVKSRSEMLHISAKGTSINNINNKINNGIQLDTSSATVDGTGSIDVVAASSTAAADVLI